MSNLTYHPSVLPLIVNSPKIQRLVTPIRLQRRRHLRSLKRRRIERQKEQKTEYDALLAKRVAEKKEKVASAKAAHKKYVFGLHSLRFGPNHALQDRLSLQCTSSCGGRFVWSIVMLFLLIYSTLSQSLCNDYEVLLRVELSHMWITWLRLSLHNYWKINSGICVSIPCSHKNWVRYHVQNGWV